MSYNQLTGTLPDYFGNLPSLDTLFVYEHDIQMNLTGYWQKLGRQSIGGDFAQFLWQQQFYFSYVGVYFILEAKVSHEPQTSEQQSVNWNSASLLRSFDFTILFVCCNMLLHGFTDGINIAMHIPTN